MARALELRSRSSGVVVLPKTETERAQSWFSRKLVVQALRDGRARDWILDSAFLMSGIEMLTSM